MSGTEVSVVPLLSIIKDDEPKTNGGRISEAGMLSSSPVRSGTPDLKTNIHADLERDIEKLKTSRNEKGDTTAKKLQNEIDQQMDLSFELIEQRQNEVKEFLRRRELEEEEHRKRAANIVKRLQDSEPENHTRTDKGGKPKGKNESPQNDKNKMITTASQTEDEPTFMDENKKRLKEEKHLKEDSQFTQTDEIEQKSQDIQTDFTEQEEEEAAGAKNPASHELNSSDIPDVIAAILDDLLEKMKRRLADEKDKIADEASLSNEKGNRQGPKDMKIEGLKSSAGDELEEIGIKHLADVENIPASAMSTPSLQSSKAMFWPTEIASSLINNKLSEGKLPKDTEKYLEKNKKSIIDGILNEISNMEDLCNIPADEQTHLTDVYNEVKEDFDRLKEISDVDEEKKGTSDRINECRKLCHDVDDLEHAINGIDDAIKSHLQQQRLLDNTAKTSTGTLSANNMKIDNILDNEEVSNSSEESSTSQVAEFDVNKEDRINNRSGSCKNTPTSMVDAQTLPELASKRKDARKQLDARIHELGQFLSTSSPETKEVVAEILYSEKAKEMSTGDSDKHKDNQMMKLEDANKALQSEIQRLAEENKEYQDIRRQEEQKNIKNNEEILGIIGEELDIPKWVNESKLQDQLDVIKQKLGEGLFRDLVENPDSHDQLIETMKVQDFYLLENQRLENALQEYDDNTKILSDKLIDSQIANEIKDIVKVNNPDTNVVIEKLQSEAVKTGQLMEGNNDEIDKIGKNLQTLVEEKSYINEVKKNAKDKKHDLEKQLALTNNDICRCFPLVDSYKNLDEKISEIDKEINVLAREAENESFREKDESKLKELDDLRRLLQKLRPYVNGDVMANALKLGSQGKWNVPNNMEVDEVIEEKKRILEEIKNTTENLEEVAKTRDSVPNIRSTEVNIELHPESKEKRGKNIDDLESELIQLNQSLEESEITADDREYLEEIIETLKNSLQEIDEHLSSLKREPVTGQDDTDAAIQEIDDELERLRTELGILDSTDSALELTVENAKDKIELACTHLQKEKERVLSVIDNAMELEKNAKSMESSEFIDFKNMYMDDNDKLKEKIDRCLGDTIDYIGYLTDQVQNAELGNTLDDIDASVIPDDRWKQVNIDINNARSDLSVLAAKAEDRNSIEFQDPAIEELAFKLESLKISQNRLDKTIEEHLQSDGDPNTLELLLKRKSNISNGVKSGEEDMEIATAGLREKLKRLEAERYEIEERLEGELAQNLRQKRQQKELLLEMLSQGVKGANNNNNNSSSNNNEAEDNKFDTRDLRGMLIKREKAFKEIKDLAMAGALENISQQDMESLSSLIPSIIEDLEDRLDEMDDFNAEKLVRNEIETKDIEAISAQRDELIKALEFIEKSYNKDETNIASDAANESNNALSVEMSRIGILKTLAEMKVKSIDRKLDDIEELNNRLVSKIEERLSSEGSHVKGLSETEEENIDNETESVKNDEDLLLAEIKEALNSLAYINDEMDILGKLTPTTMNEILCRNQSDDKLNTLFDQRDDSVEEYIKAKHKSKHTTIQAARKQLEEAEDAILSLQTNDVGVKSLDDDWLREAESSMEGELQEKTSEGFKEMLGLLVENRDLIIQKLSALKSREADWKYPKNDQEAICSVSTLEGRLNEQLSLLDDKILRYKSFSPESQEGAGRSLDAIMERIASEIESLERELQEGKLFLHADIDDDDRVSLVIDKDNVDAKEQLQRDLNKRIDELEQERVDALISKVDENSDRGNEEMEKNREEVQEALQNLKGKREVFNRKMEIEELLKDFERQSEDEEERSNGSEENYITLIERMDLIDDKIAQYAIALEEMINGVADSMSPTLHGLSNEDEEEVKSVLRNKLDALIKKRMDFKNSIVDLNEYPHTKEKLEHLVDRRKAILQELKDSSEQSACIYGEADVVRGIAELRKEYNDANQLQKQLINKKDAIEKYLTDLEEKDPDSTSGYSELSFTDKKEQSYLDVIDNNTAEINELAELLELSNEQQTKLEDDLKLAKERCSQFEEEIEKERSLLNEKDQEISDLNSDIDEMNKTTEAMLDLAQELEEQNNAKSLEIELSKDVINGLEKKLKELEQTRNEKEDGKEDGADKNKDEFIEELQNVIEKLEKEYQELLQKERQLQVTEKELQEKRDYIDMIEEKLKLLQSQVETEQLKNQKASEELDKLEIVRQELQNKEKRIVKVEEEQLRDLRSENESKNSDKEEGLDNDLKHEMDRISATEEVMKLAAELIAENDAKTLKQVELFAENEELDNILQDLVAKYNAQSAEIEELKRKLDKRGEEVKEMEKEKQDALEKIGRQKDELKGKEKLISDSRKDKVELEHEIVDCSKENGRVLEENQKLQTDIKTLEAEINKLQKLQDGLEIKSAVQHVAREQNIEVAEETGLMLAQEDANFEHVVIPENEHLLQNAKDNSKDLEDENRRLAQCVSNFEEALKKKEEEFVQVQNNALQAKKKIREIEDEKTNLEDEIKRHNAKDNSKDLEDENRRLAQCISNVEEALKKKEQEFNEAQNKVLEAKKKIREIEDEKTNLEDEIKKYNAKDHSKDLEDENRRLAQCVSNFEEALKKREEEFVQVQNKVLEARKKIREIEDEKENLEDEIKKYNAKDHSKDLEDENRRLAQCVSNFEKALKKKEEEFNEAQNKVSEARKKIREIEDEKENLEDEIKKYNAKDNSKDLEDENRRLAQCVSNFEEALKKKEEEFVQVQNKVSEAKKKIREIENENEFLEDEINKHKKDKAKLQRGIEDLERLLGDKDDLADKTCKEILENKNLISNLSEEGWKMNDKNQKIQQELSVALKQAEFLAAEVENLSDELQNLKNKNRELKLNYEDMIESSNEEKYRLKTEANKKETKIRELENDAEFLANDHKQKSKIIDNKIRKLQEDLEDESEAHEEVLKNFNRLKKAKEGIISDYEKRLQSLTEGNGELQKKVAELKLKIQEDSTEKGLQHQKIVHLKKQLEDADKDRLDFTDEKNKKNLNAQSEEKRQMAEEINAANEETRKLRKRIKDLENEQRLEIDEHEQERKRLIEELKRKGNIVTDLKAREIKEHEEDKKRRNVEMLEEELEQTYEALNELKKKLKQQQREYEEELELREGEKRRTVAEMRKKDEMIEKLEARRKSKREEKEIKQCNDEKLEEELEKMNGELKKLKKQSKEKDLEHEMELEHKEGEKRKLIAEIKKKEETIQELTALEKSKQVARSDKMKEELERSCKELDALKRKIKEIKKEHEFELKLQEDEKRKLIAESKRKEVKIADLQLKENIKDEDYLKEQKYARHCKEQLHEQAKVIQEAMLKERRIKADLEDKIADCEKLSNKNEQLQRKNHELDSSLNDKITKLQKSNAEIRKDLIDKNVELENERFSNRLKVAEGSNARKELEKQIENMGTAEERLQKEIGQQRNEVKGYQNQINEIKTGNRKDQQQRDMKITDLKEKNALLLNEISNLEKELASKKQVEELLEGLKQEYQRQRYENEKYKQRLEDIAENYVREEKVFELNKEKNKWVEEYERLKAESDVVVKYSNNLKEEIKKLNDKHHEQSKEHKKEKKLLIKNIEEEFRKRIEELMRNHLTEKEDMLRMWDEDRENWEREIGEQVKKSRLDSDRKLREQRLDLQKDHSDKMEDAISEKRILLEELNQRNAELEAERSLLERNHEEDKEAHQSEKQYMTRIIQELIHSLLHSKSNKAIMKRNHTNELTNIEDKYDRDKNYLEMCTQQEIQFLEQKLDQALIKDLLSVNKGPNRSHSTYDLLDLIPRKLT